MPLISFVFFFLNFRQGLLKLAVTIALGSMYIRQALHHGSVPQAPYVYKCPAWYCVIATESQLWQRVIGFYLLLWSSGEAGYCRFTMGFKGLSGGGGGRGGNLQGGLDADSTRKPGSLLL